ncbi:hypothetical protein L596_011928 [Steinernema carpocapsae]|uniref:RING-type domain-containing protein n=1 Tax=Steinernema carpocapsae TaxID=34508 RepID=A0A4U5NWC9_STECR|nr:hypothetical protein L596_011928 [Steinernema carpocapsae]
MTSPTCSVCHLNLDNQRQLLISKCGHVFHEACTLESLGQCPTCQDPVDSLAKVYFSVTVQIASSEEEKLADIQKRIGDLAAENVVLKNMETNDEFIKTLADRMNRLKNRVQMMRNSRNINQLRALGNSEEFRSVRQTVHNALLRRP